jgi:hypothetical protein
VPRQEPVCLAVELSSEADPFPAPPPLELAFRVYTEHSFPSFAPAPLPWLLPPAPPPALASPAGGPPACAALAPAVPAACLVLPGAPVVFLVPHAPEALLFAVHNITGFGREEASVVSDDGALVLQPPCPKERAPPYRHDQARARAAPRKPRDGALIPRGAKENCTVSLAAAAGALPAPDAPGAVNASAAAAHALQLLLLPAPNAAHFFVAVRVLGAGACNASLVVTAAARPARWGRDREQQPAPEGADLVLSTPWAQVPQPRARLGFATGRATAPFSAAACCLRAPRPAPRLPGAPRARRSCLTTRLPCAAGRSGSSRCAGRGTSTSPSTSRCTPPTQPPRRADRRPSLSDRRL